MWSKFAGAKAGAWAVVGTVCCNGIIAINCSSDSNSHLELKKHSGEVSKTLARIRASESDMRLRWIRDEDHWRKLPSRSWPEYQPDIDAIPGIRGEMEKVCKLPQSSDCEKKKFDLATALTFNQVEGNEGIGLYTELAESGYSDGQTALGICLIEGIPLLTELDNEGGVYWLRKAVEAHHTQGLYELGILYYTGSVAPLIQENETTAFQYFEKAASAGHACGMYMVAMMMMKEQGASQNLPRSIDLLYEAGEKGHRTARATLLKILEEYE